MSTGCVLALLSLLLILVTCPLDSHAEEESYGTLEDNPELLPLRLVRRYSDIDYDSFIGLMGRRSAEIPPWRKEEYPEMRGAFFINKGKRRFQRRM